MSIEAGRLMFRMEGADIGLATPLVARIWYRVTVAYDQEEGHVRIWLAPKSLNGSVAGDDTCQLLAHGPNAEGDIVIGAQLQSLEEGRLVPADVFNGKIDSPRLYRHAMEPAAIGGTQDLIAAWDFSVGIDSWEVNDISGNGHHGTLVNQPMRAATGHNWDGSETSWRGAPHLYGAIHFHDDDLSDAQWSRSLDWAVPDSLRSGVYALHIAPVDPSAGDQDDDYIPFFVRPPRGTRTARIALLLPTFTYLAYANENILRTSGADPEAGYATQKEDRYIVEQKLLSLYDKHSDGSGVCYSSRLRPIVNMRPRMLMQYLAQGRGAPHAFNADLFLVDWMEQHGFDFDVLTDEDLHKEGAELLKGYKVVLTATHNEYWSFEMIRAAQDYLRSYGRMIHLSGNGMYWVTQLDRCTQSSVEIRRSDPSSRMWDAASGEAHLSTTGELGGIWRYRGMAAPDLAGRRDDG